MPPNISAQVSTTTSDSLQISQVPILDNANFSVPESYNATSPPFSSIPGPASSEMVSPYINNTSEASIEQSAPAVTENATEDPVQLQSNNATVTPGFGKYERAHLGIRGNIVIEYPSSWTEGSCYPEVGSEIIAFCYSSTDSEEWASFQLFVQESPPVENLTLRNYLDYSIEYHNGTVRDFKIVNQTTNVTWNGTDAYLLEYEQHDEKVFPAVSLKTRETGILTGNKAIYVLYTTEKEDYSKYLEDIERMTDSIRIEKLDSYENLELGVRFIYPSSWEKITENDSYLFFQRPIQDKITSNLEIYRKDDVADPLEHINQVIADLNQSGSFIATQPQPTYVDNQFNGYLFYYKNMDNTGSETYGYFDFIIRQIGPIYAIHYYVVVKPEDYHSSSNQFETVSVPAQYDAKAEDYRSYFDELDALDELDTLLGSFRWFDAHRYEKVFDSNSIGIILHHPVELPYPFFGELEPNDVSPSKINFTKNDPRYGNALFDLKLSVFPYNRSINELDNELKNNLTQTKTSYSDFGNNTIYTNFEKKNNAYTLNFNRTADQNQMSKGRLFYGVYNNFAYLFNFTADEEKYEFLLPAVEEIYHSVTLVEFPQHTNFAQYHGTEFLDLNLQYPSDWIFRNSSKFDIVLESPTRDYFSAKVEVRMLPYDPIISLKERIGLEYSYWRKVIPDISIIESGSMDSWNLTNYYVVSSYWTGECNCIVKDKDVYMLYDNRSLLQFLYRAELDKYSSYYYTIAEKILDSIVEQVGNKTAYSENQSVNQTTGFKVSGSPVDLVVNPTTNRLYVAVRESNEVLVIDGNTDEIMGNIALNGLPNALTVNPITNKIYVASPETDKVYVIDGVTNKVTHELDAGPAVEDLAVDTNELAGMRSLVFVTNQQSNTVSVFDDTQNKLVGNITLEGEPPYNSPHSISVDSVTNLAYVTSPRSNVISIIDYKVNQTNDITTLTWRSIEELPSQWGPQHIAVDSDHSLAFVSNSLTNTISVIDSKDLPEIKSTVKLEDFFPGSLVYDEQTETLYISSLKDNSISIVEFDSEGRVSNQSRIEIDSVVYDITYNPQTEIIYLANHDAKTVSTINAATKKPTVIATFSMNPSNTTNTIADRILCEGKLEDLDTLVRLDNGTKCTPVMDESGFIFESWLVEGREYSLSGTNMSSDNSGTTNDINFASAVPLLGNSPDGKRYENSTIEVTSYGTYTVNLERKLDVLQSSVGFISVGILIVVSILTAVLYRHIPRVFSGLAKLEIATIIQIDSSAIFGILILLTLSATGGNSPFGSNAPQLWITTLIVIIPFALSAILVMTREKYKTLGTGFMLAGFVILSTSISLIVAAALGPSLSAGVGSIFE